MFKIVWALVKMPQSMSPYEETPVFFAVANKHGELVLEKGFSVLVDFIIGNFNYVELRTSLNDRGVLESYTIVVVSIPNIHIFSNVCAGNMVLVSTENIPTPSIYDPPGPCRPSIPPADINP